MGAHSRRHDILLPPAPPQPSVVLVGPQTSQYARGNHSKHPHPHPNWPTHLGAHTVTRTMSSHASTRTCNRAPELNTAPPDVSQAARTLGTHNHQPTPGHLTHLVSSPGGRYCGRCASSEPRPGLHTPRGLCKHRHSEGGHWVRLGGAVMLWISAIGLHGVSVRVSKTTVPTPQPHVFRHPASALGPIQAPSANAHCRH